MTRKDMLWHPFRYRLWNSEGDIRWHLWANQNVAWRMKRPTGLQRQLMAFLP